MLGGTKHSYSRNRTGSLLFIFYQVKVENIYLCCFTSSGLWPDEKGALFHGAQRAKGGRSPAWRFLVQDRGGEPGTCSGSCLYVGLVLLFFIVAK